MALSILSLSSFREASAAYNSTSDLVKSAAGIGSAIVSLFWVRVPVLSEHSTSTPANSSIAASLLTIAFFLERLIAPMAMVTVRMAGKATGMEATVSTMAKRRVSIKLSCRNNATITMIKTRNIAMMIKKFPIRMTARSKWLLVLALSTSFAVLPK